MKKALFFLVMAFLGTTMGWSQNKVLTNYSYKFRIAGLKDTSVYMGFHFGDKKYIKDTARVDSKGWVEFKGKDTIPGGIYLLVLPNKKWFEFVVNEPTFTMETDTNDFVGNMKVKGSVENTLWIDYLRYMQSKQKVLDDLRKKMEAITDKKSKEYTDLEAEMKKESEAINTFRVNIMSKNPDAFVTSVFKAMKDIEIPEGPKEDSLFAYRYFRTHYFDNINLTDNRILRTPIFEQKLVYYFEKLVPQVPDSIIAEADRMAVRMKGDAEMFKFLIHTVTYNFERSQIMCMDRVFVHMVETYYEKGLTPWVDQNTLSKMIERKDKLKPVLCGERVMDIILPDTAGVFHSLYSLTGDISILYFWDATCSHCKKATPLLKELYTSYLKPNGIEVFAVEGELEDKEWIKYLKENKLPWINVSDNPDMNKNPEKYIYELKVTDLNSLNFRHHFDLSSYPVMFVLDKDKRIIAKKLGVEQLKDFLDRYKKKAVK